MVWLKHLFQLLLVCREEWIWAVHLNVFASRLFLLGEIKHIPTCVQTWPHWEIHQTPNPPRIESNSHPCIQETRCRPLWQNLLEEGLPKEVGKVTSWFRVWLTMVNLNELRLVGGFNHGFKDLEKWWSYGVRQLGFFLKSTVSWKVRIHPMVPVTTNQMM